MQAKITFETGFSKYIRKDGKVTLSEHNRWRVSVNVNGKRIRLGSFKTEQEAINKLNEYNNNPTLLTP